MAILAAVACACMAGAPTVAITNAENNVILSLSKNYLLVRAEHGWILVDAGKLQSNTIVRDARSHSLQKKALQKKGEEPKLLPKVSYCWFCLVAAVFGGRYVRRRARASARIGQNNRQVSHGQVTCTEIADERKAVSILEVANRERIALISRDQVRGQASPNRATGDVARVRGGRRSGRSGGRATVPGEYARAVLRGSDLATNRVRILRRVRHGQTGVKAGLVRDVRVQEDGTANVDRVEGPGGRSITHEARDGQAAGRCAGRYGGGVAEVHRGGAGSRNGLGHVGGVGDVCSERESFDSVGIDRKST